MLTKILGIQHSGAKLVLRLVLSERLGPSTDLGPRGSVGAWAHAQHAAFASKCTWPSRQSHRKPHRAFFSVPIGRVCASQCGFRLVCCSLRSQVYERLCANAWAMTNICSGPGGGLCILLRAECLFKLLGLSAPAARPCVKSSGAKARAHGLVHQHACDVVIIALEAVSPTEAQWPRRLHGPRTRTPSAAPGPQPIPGRRVRRGRRA